LRLLAHTEIKLAEVDGLHTIAESNSGSSRVALLHQLGVDQHRVGRAINLTVLDHHPRGLQRPRQERESIRGIGDLDAGERNLRLNAVPFDEDRCRVRDAYDAVHRCCLDRYCDEE
jgi:hypothetical protein